MQTNLAQEFKGTPEGAEAEQILRKCVHCGFCSATCPTYQLLGDELDSPRGRIYLIKQVLEGQEPTRKTQLHLDRCLTCRACETTCPSGVHYGRLVDIGRAIVERKVGRGALSWFARKLLGITLASRCFFRFMLAVGQFIRPGIPSAFRTKIPPRPSPAGTWPAPRHKRRMLALAGCVQSSLAPAINASAARVLDRAGVSLIEMRTAGCCGALRFHLNDQDVGKP